MWLPRAQLVQSRFRAPRGPLFASRRVRFNLSQRAPVRLALDILSEPLTHLPTGRPTRSARDRSGARHRRPYRFSGSQSAVLRQALRRRYSRSRVANLGQPSAPAVEHIDASASTAEAPPAAIPTGDRALRSQVWGLAIPAIGEQLLALGVGVSDTFLAGHLSVGAMAHVGYDRATALAAVGAASTAVWVVINAFFAINIGVTALVARATGSGDKPLAARAAGQGALLGLCVGLVMTALAVPLATAITRILGVDGQVADLAASYIRVFSMALPATGIASACTAAMRGAGDARRPLLVMLVVNGANIVGSWTLMNGSALLHVQPIGVVGSACGAAAGWTLGAALAFALLWRAHPRAPRLNRMALHPDRATAIRILRVGLPSAAEITVFQIGIVTFGRVVVALGPAAYAANTTINTVESLGTLPAFGFAVATTALVGQALGAGDQQLAGQIVLAALRPCVALMGTLGLVALLLPHLLLGLFVADTSVLDAGGIAMRLSCLTMPASGIAFVFNGALRGAGDTKFPVVVRATGTWGIRLPLALCMIPIFALPGARVAMALDYCTQASLSYWRFRSGRWRQVAV